MSYFPLVTGWTCYVENIISFANELSLNLDKHVSQLNFIMWMDIRDRTMVSKAWYIRLVC